MPRLIVGYERISRFLFSSGELTREFVKPRAFDPRKYNEVSICCSDRLGEDEVWRIAESVLQQKRTQNPAIRLYGRGDFFASEVLQALARSPGGIPIGVRIEQDDIGWERHGGIKNWPANDELRAWIQEIFASKCRLVRC
jgi:hypothetical protein